MINSINRALITAGIVNDFNSSVGRDGTGRTAGNESGKTDGRRSSRYCNKYDSYSDADLWLMYSEHDNDAIKCLRKARQYQHLRLYHMNKAKEIADILASRASSAGVGGDGSDC